MTYPEMLEAISDSWLCMMNGCSACGFDEVPEDKGNSKLPWRKAGPPNHLDDKVDSDQ